MLCFQASLTPRVLRAQDATGGVTSVFPSVLTHVAGPVYFWIPDVRTVIV